MTFGCRNTEKSFNDQRVRRFQAFERLAWKRFMVLHAVPSLEALIRVALRFQRKSNCLMNHVL